MNAKPDPVTTPAATPSTNSQPKPMTIDELFSAFGRVMVENDYLRKQVAYYQGRLAELGVKEG